MATMIVVITVTKMYQTAVRGPVGSWNLNVTTPPDVFLKVTCAMATTTAVMRQMSILVRDVFNLLVKNPSLGTNGIKTGANW